MNITIISTAYPLRGGIAHFIGLLYKELIKENIVKIFTFKRQYPSIFFPGKSQLEAGDTSEKIPSEILIDSINPFNWIITGLKIKKENPDLIIFKYWMPFFAPCFGTITRIIKSNRKTKALVICDNVIPHEKRIGDLFFTKYFFNKIDYFILMSETVKTDLLNLFPEAKYKLLFHPVYSNFGETVEKSIAKQYLKLNAEKIILFFGFVRDYKGLDVLLEALFLIKEKLNIKLLIAGEFYTEENKYLEMIEKFGIDQNVILFKDFIPTADVKYFFCAADAVILPYKNATQSGIVQIANNFGKPVIGTNVGGLPEIIKNDETGLIVEANNPGKLSEAILKFYNEDKEEIFSSNVKKELDNFSWEKFTDSIFELIKN